MKNTRYASIAIVGLSATLAGCSTGSTPVATAVITPTPVSAVPAPVALPPEPEPAPTPTVTVTATPTPTVTVTATPTPTVTVTVNPEDAGGGNPAKSDGQSTTPEPNAKQGIFGTFAGTLTITEDYGSHDENGDEISDVGLKLPYQITIPESCGQPQDGDTCNVAEIFDGESYQMVFSWSSSQNSWVSTEIEQTECIDEDGDVTGHTSATLDETEHIKTPDTIDVFIHSYSGTQDGCEPSSLKVSGTLRLK